MKKHASEDCFGVQVAGGYADTMSLTARVSLYRFIELLVGFLVPSEYFANFCLFFPHRQVVYTKLPHFIA